MDEDSPSEQYPVEIYSRYAILVQYNRTVLDNCPMAKSKPFLYEFHPLRAKHIAHACAIEAVDLYQNCIDIRRFGNVNINYCKRVVF